MVAELNMNDLFKASALIKTVLDSQKGIDDLNARVDNVGFVHGVQSENTSVIAEDAFETDQILRALKSILNHRIGQAVKSLRADFDINITCDVDDI